MINEPLVSIIIPCYNYGHFLKEAVESVRQQTYSNWECLIVDDGSKDNTRLIAGQLVASDRRVSYYYKINGGLSSARNFGIGLAKGSYICFLDTDDLFDRQKIEAQLNCFKNNPSADIVYGEFRFFESADPSRLYTSKNKDSHFSRPKISGTGDEVLRFLNDQNITVVSAPLIKKPVFDKVGNFDESYKSYEDWHFWLRCALKNCSFIFCSEPQVCTYIRFGHESMMSDKKKLLRASIQLREFLSDKLPAKFRLYNFYRLLRSRFKLAIT